jgi:SAM-dependent methyltransferase
MDLDWQNTFFRGVSLDAWRHITTDEITRRETDFLERALGLSAGARVLDLACGNGRHSVSLAKRGYQVTGVDQSEEFIEEARRTMPDSIRWVHGDMRSLAWAREFDAAFCWGNSFGYLNRDEAASFLRDVGRSLKPGGRFVVDTGMVAESILPSLVRNRWYRLGDILMLSQNQYDPTESRLDIEYTFVRNGQTETRPTSSYVLTSGELRKMHEEAGLVPVEMFGSIESEKYQIGSARLILASRVHLQSTAPAEKYES